MSIHPTAIVDPSAQIAEDVEIGPFCVIGPHVKIDSGCIIDSGVKIDCYTEIGKNCKIYHGAVIGTPPQDVKFKPSEITYIKIGSGNLIREFVTIHSATGAGNETVVGDNNFLMAYVHVGHNCHLGSNITISNAASFAGHVHIEDNAVIGGMTGVHQFVRIGSFAMVGGCSRITKDVPPFSMIAGSPERFYGLNVVGLRRNGIDLETRNLIKRAYSIFCQKNKSEAIAEMETMDCSSKEMQHILEFVKFDSKRGICFKRDSKVKKDKDTEVSL